MKTRSCNITFSYLAFMLSVVSCGDKPAKDEHKFLEYVEVTGQCREDHVEQFDSYEGSFVHWFNVTKGDHSVYGAVSNKVDAGQAGPEKLVERTLRSVRQPYKYFPPTSIEFSNLTPPQISSRSFTLSGISTHITGKGECTGPQYESTCNLKVIRRLNYLPDATQRK
jgi:hypothetical protein